MNHRCPHGCGSPDACSQCLGAVVKKITRDDQNVLYEDGRPLGTVRELQEAREARRPNAGYSVHPSRPRSSASDD